MIGAGRLPGILALAFLAAIVGLALAGLLSAGGGDDATTSFAEIGTLLGGSVLQAGLSTLASVLLGAAIALALARRVRFRGRAILIAALNAATVLPAIVTVFAIVAVFGRSGWFGDLSRFLGLDYGSWVFGLDGVILAHILLNAPLAARVFLAALRGVTPEHWRLAAQLGMPPAAIFRFIDLPVLRREAIGIGALIFLACFTSFAIVLALGGGPAVATLEVAIFEAVQYDADFPRAALLAMLQLGATLALLAPLALLFGRRQPEAASTGVEAPRPDAGSRILRLADRGVLALAAVFILLPLTTIAVGGLAAIGTLADAAAVAALATSLAAGIPAGLLSALLAVALATLARDLRVRAGRRRAADLVGLAAVLILVVSPLALSAGLFVVLRPLVDPFAIAVLLIILVNALMALPFAYRQIEPPLVLSAERYGRLGDSLGLSGLARLRLVDWPLLKAPLIVAATMAIALSLGDLGVAAFFGSGRLMTLPLLIHDRLGAYRIDEAASAALLLTLLVTAMFLLAQRWAGGWVAAAR